MTYGYARVSTGDQNPEMQLSALKRAGCKRLFEHRLSGATTKRHALLRCLKKLERGDTLIVWKLDRRGGSLRDLITMLDDLKQCGVRFQSLTEAIDTETATSRAIWQMIGVRAELERSMIGERTRAGVKAAQRRGVKFGQAENEPPADQTCTKANKTTATAGRKSRTCLTSDGILCIGPVKMT